MFDLKDPHAGPFPEPSITYIGRAARRFLLQMHNTFAVRLRRARIAHLY
jgi:hypothetical protein